MSKTAETTTVKINPANDTLPTLDDRPEVVAYAASLGIRVTERYVRQETRLKALPCFIVANKCHYSRADVRAWLAAKRAT